MFQSNTKGATRKEGIGKNNGVSSSSSKLTAFAFLFGFYAEADFVATFSQRTEGRVAGKIWGLGMDLLKNKFKDGTPWSMSAFCELSRSRIIRVDCREGSHLYTILAAAITILASHSTAHFLFPLNIHLIFPTPAQTSSYPSSTPQKSQFFLPR